MQHPWVVILCTIAFTVIVALFILIDKVAYRAGYLRALRDMINMPPKLPVYKVAEILLQRVEDGKLDGR